MAIGAGALLVHGGRRSLVWVSEPVLALGALLCASRLGGTEGWTLVASVLAVFALLITIGRHLDLLAQRLLAAERRCDDVRTNADLAHQALLEANADLAYRAAHDPLTGLANRTTLQETLDRQIRAIRGPRTGLAVLYLDLDHFKDVNDRFGHDTGDRLLGLLAKRLLASVRPGDLVVRLGGDEMACVLPGVTEEESNTLAQRLLTRATMAVNLDQVTLQVGMSIGLAWTNSSTTEPDELLRRADEALYEAKHAGRNRISVALPVLAD
jgi:diguanylate cyclase (GGDEF)-like protein